MGLASWLGQKIRKQRETEACIVCRTNSKACLLFPSHGLPSKYKNNDAICLNLKTCIYKHFLVILPGERGGNFHSLTNGFLLPSGTCTKVGIPIRGWLLLSSLFNACSLEGAMVLNIAGKWWREGEDVDFQFWGCAGKLKGINTSERLFL